VSIVTATVPSGWRRCGTGTSVVLYSQDPVDDLTSIDVAPLNGYFTGSIEAVTGFAYVFETELSDGLHYGAVRITHVGPDYVILDWAYQTDFGNPELRRVGSRRGSTPVALANEAAHSAGRKLAHAARRVARRARRWRGGIGVVCAGARRAAAPFR